MKKHDCKKQWFKKLYTQSQEQISPCNVSITWSSSEDDEPAQQNAKTYSVCDRKCNEWIKRSSGLWRTYKSGMLCTASEQLQPVILDVSNQIESDESPILCRDKLSHMSPILTQYKSNSENLSPVLGKGKMVRKRIACCLTEQNETKQSVNTTTNSPDLFSSEQSQDRCTISTTSLTGSIKKSSQNIIDDSQTSEVHSISILPSQDSTEVPLNSNSQGTSLDRKSDQYLLYYKEPPPKKKKYRKGGLCSQIQKVVREQKTRISIWQHEIFLKKNDMPITEESLSIVFSLKNKWKEFGCSFYECTYVTTEAYPTTSLSMSLLNTEETFILIIGFIAIPNLSYKMESKYIFYPPYSRRTVTYKNLIKTCYFNVSKVKKYTGDLEH